MLSMLMRIGADATGAQRVVAGVAKKTEATFKGVSDEITKRWGNLFTGAAIVGGIQRMAGAVVDTVDEIKDLADLLELSTDEVQKLQVASERAAVKINTVGAALRNIEDLRASAETGDKRASGIFAALGIDPTKGSSLDILQAAMAAANGDAQKQVALFDLVGKKAGQLRNVVAELQRLGPIRIIDKESLDAIDQANNAFKDLNRELTAAAATPAGFWARMLGRERETQANAQRAGAPIPGLLKPLSMFISFAEEFFSTEGGVDLSALPIDPNRKQKTGTGASAIETSPLSLAAQSDALGRIGLFVGGRANVGEQMVTIGNYQLTELRRMRSILEEANR